MKGIRRGASRGEQGKPSDHTTGQTPSRKTRSLKLQHNSEQVSARRTGCSQVKTSHWRGPRLPKSPGSHLWLCSGFDWEHQGESGLSRTQQ
jgi:hypothetical protein